MGTHLLIGCRRLSQVEVKLHPNSSVLSIHVNFQISLSQHRSPWKTTHAFSFFTIPNVKSKPLAKKKRSADKPLASFNTDLTWVTPSRKRKQLENVFDLRAWDHHFVSVAFKGEEDKVMVRKGRKECAGGD